MELHPLNRGKRDNRYCGPAVVSYITGMNTSEAAAIIRMNTGRRSIITTHCGEIKMILRQCGFKMHNVESFHNIKTAPTIARWLKDSKERRGAGRVYLILAGRHWQLITGRRYACGRTGTLVSIKDPKVPRRVRVREVFEITHASKERWRTEHMLMELNAHQQRVRATHNEQIVPPSQKV